MPTKLYPPLPADGFVLRPRLLTRLSTLDSALEAGSANPRELTVALLQDLAEFSSKSVVLALDEQVLNQLPEQALLWRGCSGRLALASWSSSPAWRWRGR